MRYHKGGILIEFAFSIPILISLLFFINDHYRFHELKDKVKSSAYLAASMIQQITNTRTNKQLTIDDLARISYASCLNLFHTDAMFSPYPFGIHYIVRYFYVKRNNDNSYLCYIYWTSTGNTNVKRALLDGMNRSCSSSGNRTKAQVQRYHPDLVCSNDGEERLLIICYYGATASTNFSKSKLGLFLLDPNFGQDGNFSHQLVITLKPGLFPAKTN